MNVGGRNPHRFEIKSHLLYACLFCCFGRVKRLECRDALMA